MKVLLVGTVEFSLKTLEKLIDLKVDLIGVCTKEASTFNSDFADLKPLCIANKIPYLTVDDINSRDSIQWITALNPDVIFCFGWSSLIKKEILNIAPMRVVGFHPAKLPMNRGRHPLIWALALGLKESASTFFFMDEGADSGDMLSQVDFEISYQDDARSIYNKVIDIALCQIEEFIPKLEKNNFTRIRQNNQHSNSWRKRNESDGEIDFRMSSRSIYNLTRALTKPYVGAHIKFNETNYSVWKVKESNDFQENIEPGKVLRVFDKIFVVKSYDGAIEIIEHDFKEMPKVGEYL
jgi:methionyl-tRNA formyltransferase